MPYVLSTPEWTLTLKIKLIIKNSRIAGLHPTVETILTSEFPLPRLRLVIFLQADLPFTRAQVMGWQLVKEGH